MNTGYGKSRCRVPGKLGTITECFTTHGRAHPWTPSALKGPLRQRESHALGFAPPKPSTEWVPTTDPTSPWGPWVNKFLSFAESLVCCPWQIVTDRVGGASVICIITGVPSPQSAPPSFSFLSESWKNSNSYFTGLLWGLSERWHRNRPGPSPAQGDLRQAPPPPPVLQISILDWMWLLFLKVVILSLVKSFKIWFPTAIDFKYHACFRQINFFFFLIFHTLCLILPFSERENRTAWKHESPACSEGQRFQS